jgi:hypothetical protein
MEWERWVWRASGNRRLRKSIVATVGLLLIWSMAFGPLVEWRQRLLLERMQPLSSELFDEPPQPSELSSQ